MESIVAAAIVADIIDKFDVEVTWSSDAGPWVFIISTNRRWWHCPWLILGKYTFVSIDMDGTISVSRSTFELADPDLFEKIHDELFQFGLSLRMRPPWWKRVRLW